VVGGVEEEEEDEEEEEEEVAGKVGAGVGEVVGMVVEEKEMGGGEGEDI